MMDAVAVIVVVLPEAEVVEVAVDHVYAVHARESASASQSRCVQCPSAVQCSTAQVPSTSTKGEVRGLKWAGL